MKINETIIIQRKIPNGSKASYLNSYRIAEQCVTQPDLMLRCWDGYVVSSWRLKLASNRGWKKGNVPAAEVDIAVATVFGGWIHGWVPCISWYPRFVKEDIHHFLPLSANKVSCLDLVGVGSLCAGRIRA